MVLLVALAVMWCQGTVGFESGVATITPGEQWVMGPSDRCIPYTVLSPDGLNRGEDRIRVRRATSVGRDVEGKDACVARYRLKTVDVTVAGDGNALSKDQEGQLATLLLEQPAGFVITRYVDQGTDRNKRQIGDVGAATIKRYLDRVLPRLPGVTDERRPLIDTTAVPETVAVTAIYRTGCLEEVAR